MELLNLLSVNAQNDIPIAGFWNTFDVSLNWIGDLIRLLVQGIGVVGIGIILFSLILKCITLPLDVYQRISMRKQNIKMKENKEKMEKLQKQYANNKELYNQKVMEMYKENGISIFSSCLPMIVSLVIFIVAINAFNAYSQFANIQNYNGMVKAYNAKLNEYCVQLDEDAKMSFSEDGKTIYVYDEDPSHYIYYTVANTTYTEDTIKDAKPYVEKTIKSYYVNWEKVMANETLAETFKDHKDVTSASSEEVRKARDVAVTDYFKAQAQTAVLNEYEATLGDQTGFLWIKNIWVTDASYKSPVLEYEDFASAAQQEEFEVPGIGDVEYTSIGSHLNSGNPYDKDVYNVVTGQLGAYKEAANGYFILIALSIGTILLQQFVMMRSQKEQQKYSTVDGQGGSQQKMMMVIMTGMFAIFSFMYSSAFAIYLIVSNVFSMISTFVINKFVDRSMAKKAAAVNEVRLDKRSTGRLEAAQKAGRASAQESRDKKGSKADKSNENSLKGKKNK